jgi:hypothetical protein
LNTTDAETNYGATWLSATSTTINVQNEFLNANQSYVAYIFAHDAGGFGLTGTDNVISCGSFTTDGSGNATVSLGYEPQWILFKNSSSTGPWYMLDTFRQWSLSEQNYLTANTSNAESPVGAGAANFPTATGFNTTGAFTDPSSTYIYIAIRRGPMKVPTVGTSVFNNVARTGTGVSATITGVGFAPDLVLGADRTGANTGDDCRYFWVDRLRGRSQYLNSAVTAAEVGPSSATQDVTAFGMDGISVGTTANAYFNVTTDPLIHHYFKRAPSFFDEVCYTATQSSSTGTAYHNLGVVPELIIIKARDSGNGWKVYSATLGVNQYLQLHTDIAAATDTGWATVSSTSFFLKAGNGQYVAYLFATCAGVSKVGSYTGTGTTKQIDCGFTGGARFVLIKKTSGTGSWYVWDSARGIVSGNDPYLLLNSTAAEVTNTDYIDTYSAGFEISSTAPSEINENGGSFIFFAVS